MELSATRYFNLGMLRAYIWWSLEEDTYVGPSNVLAAAYSSVPSSRFPRGISPHYCRVITPAISDPAGPNVQFKYEQKRSYPALKNG